MRQQRFSKLACALLLGSFACAATALEFRATAEHGAVFFDGPQVGAKRLFVTSRGYPVEIVVDNKDWLRVRDQSGTLAWVEKKALTNKRSVVVTASKAEVRAQADAKSLLLFTAEKNLTLELLETGKSGWVKIQHRDGAQGFIRIEEVWGV